VARQVTVGAFDPVASQCQAAACAVLLVVCSGLANAKTVDIRAEGDALKVGALVRG
jgi:hypothetical protein